MATIKRLPEANLDLYNIWDYISADSIEQADKQIRRINEVFQVLAENPEMGRARDEVRPHLRSFLANRYVIFYHVLADKVGIEVVRVLHQHQDIEGEFGGEL